MQLTTMKFQNGRNGPWVFNAGELASNKQNISVEAIQQMICIIHGTLCHAVITGRHG